MKLYIKWTNLTADQKKEVESVFQEEIKDKKIILNQRAYLINPTNGRFVNRKDF